MYCSFITKAILILASVISMFSQVPCQRVPFREGKEPVRRDYRPSKWITNSAMDVWYGNKTMIDIVWREFSDFMYKLTDRADRSINMEDYYSNLTTVPHFHDEVIRVDVKFSSKINNETLHTMSFEHPLNMTIFKP